MADVAQVLFVSPHTVLYITFIYLMLKWINYLRVWVIVCRLCESVREKESVCVCGHARAYVCAGAGICADPTFPWRQHNAVRGSRLQGPARETSTGTAAQLLREK